MSIATDNVEQLTEDGSDEDLSPPSKTLEIFREERICYTVNIHVVIYNS